MTDVSALDFYVHLIRRLLGWDRLLGLLTGWEGVGGVVTEGIFVLLSGVGSGRRGSGRLVDVEGTLHHHGQATVVGTLVRSMEVTDQVRAGYLSKWRWLILGEGVVEVLTVEILNLTLDGRGRSLRLWLRLRTVVGRGKRTGTLKRHHR